MLCAIAKIDSVARERLVKLLQIPEHFGIPPRNVYGHITLATYIGNDEDSFILSCKAILAGYKNFSVCYDKIEVFESTSIIVAVPQRENAIVAIQKEISRCWTADLDKWTQADVWQAHTTLVYNPHVDLYAIAKAMQEEFEPFFAQVDRIEFSRVCEEGYENIDFIELNKLDKI